MAKMLRTGRSLEKELFIKASLEQVFQALTRKEELERWFLVKADMELYPGGAIRFEWGSGMVETGKVLVFEPPHRLSFTWEAVEPSATTITFELIPENEGTRLRLTHSGFSRGEDWDDYYSSVEEGWRPHLNTLKAWLETRQETVAKYKSCGATSCS